MLKEIKKNIRNLRKKKYQKILFSKKDIFLRNQAIQYIFNLDVKNDCNKENCQSCRFFLKNLKDKNIITFYKKFNVNIALKAIYDPQTLLKKTNKSACLKSYFILSEFLIKNKRINDVQKLNTFLKINDLFILKFEKNKHTGLIKYFKKNIQYERRLLKLYI